VVFVHFASKPKKRWHTFSPISTIQRGSGKMVKSWLVQTQEWTPDFSIEAWWTMMPCNPKPNHKAIASIMMLVSWKIWKERNVRVFNMKAVPTMVLLKIIKSETRLWVARVLNI
jgi:hypothetical protein